MLETVVAALKRTSKGNLHYDRSWLFEGRAKDILHDVSCLTRIHQSPKEEVYCSILPSQQVTEVKDVPKSAPLPSSSPKKEPDALQDNCFRILEYEEIRKQKVQDMVLSFVSEIGTFGEQGSQHVEQQMALLQHGWKVEEQKRTDQITRLHHQEMLEVKEQQSRLKEHQKTQSKRLNEKVKEVEERQKALEEQELRRKQEQQERHHQLLAIQSQLLSLASSYADVLGTCSRMDLLQQKPAQHLQVVLDAQNALQHILKSTSHKELSLEDSQVAQTHFLNAKVGLNNLQSDIARANAKQRELEQKLESPSSPVKLVADHTDKLSTKTVSEPEPIPTGTEIKQEEVRKDLGSLTGCVDQESYSIYKKLVKSCSDWEEAYKPLETDSNFKKLHFEMKKAVNTPVNAISSQSGRQLRDKLDRLRSLLSGKTAPGTAGKPGFSCQSHPLCLHFCTQLLAKKIVSQAESQVSSHQEAAFPLAAVTVGLWAHFPKFGELLLAQLYIRCPYLLPIYHQQSTGQTEKEYHTLLGYKYEDREMEPQDQFLKRMGGIVCFYAALVQTSAPPGYTASHPHGIQYGWQFLTRLVNLRPRFDITATVLYHFLEVAGNALYRTYGKQMHKLILYLHNDYIPQIHKVTAGKSGGPVSRLETFLADTLRTGRIGPPSGTLTAGFWST